MNELVLKTQEDVVSFANNYITSHNIIPSKNYNVTSAMVSLYNIVLSAKDKQGKMAIETCTPLSIQNAIYECINKELTPSRNQAYFIPYGNELKQMDSYFGLEKMVKDLCGANIYGDVVREGDAFRIENRIDGTKVVYHQTNAMGIFENKPIIGAYAVATDVESGRVINSDVMSLKDIKVSLSKSRTGGQTHKEFPEEMYKKVVIRRLCKHLLNKSDDSKYVTITNTDGTVTRVNNYDELLDDSGFVDTSYTINTDEQIAKEKEKFTPTDADVINHIDLKLDEPDAPASVVIPEGAIEISYAEYKNNKESYEMIKDSYNPSTKTVFVIQK